MSSAARHLWVGESQEQGYPLYIGTQLLQRLPQLLCTRLRARRALLISDAHVAELYQETCLKVLHPHLDVAPLVLPAGEEHKTLAGLAPIYDTLLRGSYGRDCALLALGGGVVGDMTGFAAATYQRGVEYVQLPTTLLAQVDASVGGKTGVNHPLGKNMIGAFYRPRCVVIDTSTLDSLPLREFAAGCAEIVKHALIRDANFFHWLAEHHNRLRGEQEICTMAITRSCGIKGDIVTRDEREAGVRALLNFGHSFAHALETLMQYRDLLHGEAVAIGMLLAARVSEQLGWLSSEDRGRLGQLLEALGLPTRPPQKFSPQEWLKAMQRDKKNLAGKRRLVLLRGIGNAVVSDSASDALLRDILERYATP